MSQQTNQNSSKCHTPCRCTVHSTILMRTIHVTIHNVVRSKNCLVYCSIFNRKNCRYTIHDTVETIWTVKVIGVMMTIGSICSHDTINRSPNVFFYTQKTLHKRSSKSLSVSKLNHSQSQNQITLSLQTKSLSASKPNHSQSRNQITLTL